MTATALEIAPTPTTAPIFSTLLTACAEVVRGVGNLRNFLSDSHGHGQHSPAPDWRHAELAINLAGSMATYLLALWENRQPTLSALITQHLEATDHRKPLGTSHKYTLRRLREAPIAAKVAAWLTIDDIVDFARARAQGTAPSTVKQDLTFLSGVLKKAKLSGDVIRLAMPTLTGQGFVGNSKERLRRPKPAELERVLAHFRVQDKKPRAKIPMATLVEFAATSGRRISDIAQLRWKDLDYKNRTCISRGKEFKLIGRAWDIVVAQPQQKDRIFPYNAKSVGAAFTMAANEVAPDVVFNDLRLEAICRLLEGGFGIHEVSAITGQRDHNILANIKHTLVDMPRNTP